MSAGRRRHVRRWTETSIPGATKYQFQRYFRSARAFLLHSDHSWLWLQRSHKSLEWALHAIFLSKIKKKKKLKQAKTLAQLDLSVGKWINTALQLPQFPLLPCRRIHFRLIRIHSNAGNSISVTEKGTAFPQQVIFDRREDDFGEKTEKKGKVWPWPFLF